MLISLTSRTELTRYPEQKLRRRPIPTDWVLVCAGRKFVDGLMVMVVLF
jgi:hypothetical protein